MRIRIICMALCLMCGHWARAQAVSVSPVPQEMQVREGKLNFSSDIQIVGSEAASPYAVERLKALCGKSTGNGGKIDIYIGEKGDKAVRKYAKAIPQQPEGYWTRSMLDPDFAPGAETSGTAFFTYALMWGVNNGLLDSGKYMPVIMKAWKYLSETAVQADGSVGYVQPIGDRAIPGQVISAGSTADFGVGAFLLAACEVARHYKN